MKKHLLLALLLTCFIFASKNTSAQNYLGVHSSNYAGIMGADLQPASIVDSRFVVDINLFSANFNFWQNGKYFDASAMPKRRWRYSFEEDTSWYTTDTNSFYDQHIYNVDDLTDPNTKAKGLYSNFQLDILNFMFHIKPTIAVGLAVKMRSTTNVRDLNPKILKLAETELEFSDLWYQRIDGTLLEQNHMTWAEYGLNYAQVISDEGEHFFKAGARLKFLQGIAASYVYSNDLEFELFNSDTATTFRGDFNYGYSKNIDEFINGNGATSFNDIYKLTSKLGIGGDIGFVYEWRPNWKEYKYDMDGETNIWRRDKEKYKIRAGISLLDMGGMKFEKSGLNRDFSVDTENLDLTIFSEANDLAEFDEIIDSLIINDPDWTASEDTAQTFYMNTPTALSLQLDFHIWKDFYVNTSAYINVVGKKNPHKVVAANQFVINPTYDFKWAGVGIPVSWNEYSGWKAGIGARLGPMTIGFPDLKTLFPGGKIRGTEFYAGLRLPVLYSHPSDIDGDLTSDDLDECVDVPGLWAFRGCPDTDKDGIQDSQDDCVNTPGIEKFKGCPDTDGDGIKDSEDRCPEVAGPIAYQGCPDTDNDSIVDIDDDCPNVAGIAAFNGCPDTDGDGLKDEDDACPKVAGPKELNGCPDTDNDGILDFLDNCPNEFGPKENNGCPWPDTDGDGLLDKEDKCPYLAGPIKNQGCPYQDTDGDGIPDAEDKCPATPGVIENQGCPEIEKEVVEILQTAFDNLEFETGKAVIKAESIESLTKLAEVLAKKPEWKLQISGHTDNVGAAQSNLILSKKRAESVRAFFVTQGINEDRMSALYFGETVPIADNSTKEGRQTNRRVEMEIIFD